MVCLQRSFVVEALLLFGVYHRLFHLSLCSVRVGAIGALELWCVCKGLLLLELSCCLVLCQGICIAKEVVVLPVLGRLGFGCH